MGMLKEVFVDHTIDGEEIPANVLWVGAMTPYDSLKTFIVLPHPPSMDQLVLDFGTFKPDQEQDFISVLLNMRYEPLACFILLFFGSFCFQCSLFSLFIFDFLCFLDFSLFEYRYDTPKAEEFQKIFPEERQSLLTFLLFSQCFVREAKIDRVRLSIRDIFKFKGREGHKREEKCKRDDHS
jgi:hypothetical protein